MTLSLVIPTFDRAKFLSQTIQTVLDQTRLPDEIIVVDDGSTDDTRAVVETFGARVQYHYQSNAGLAAARTKGLSLSTGELLSFLDSDDLLLPTALGELEAALVAQPEAAVAYCRSQTIDAAGHVLEARWEKEDHTGEVWRDLVDGNFIRSSGCALIRRRCLEEVGPWDTNFRANEDWELWVRLAEKWPFTRVDEALFGYRLHGANMSDDRFRMHRETFRLLHKHLVRNRTHRERRAYLRMARARARSVVAHECSFYAFEAQRRGDGREALRQLFRALRLRRRYLLQPRFLLRMLRACRALRSRGTPAWRMAS